MSRKRDRPEQFIGKLPFGSAQGDEPAESREAEVELAQGATAGQVCKKIGVTKQTYYRWRAEYGGMRVDQAKRLKQLEKENSQLKKLVAEQALDIAILKEAAAGNY